MTSVEYNHEALEKHWFLKDLPETWRGYEILNKGDYDKNRNITGDERYAVDWIAFTRAVFEIQKEMGTTVDGMLGPNTLRALQKHYSVNTTDIPSTNYITKVGSIIFNRPEEPTAHPINKVSGKNNFEKVIANMWNNYGAAILDESEKHKIPINTALAVFCVESKSAYDLKTGLVIIRFEPHVFKRYSGGKIIPAERGGQSSEWRNIKKAAEAHEEAAFLSVSFGLPQLMGFNWKVTDLNSVFEMAKEFQKSCRVQVKGFFDFIEKNNLAKYILREDWYTFTKRYNGPGNIYHYSEELKKALYAVNNMNIGE